MQSSIVSLTSNQCLGAYFEKEDIHTTSKVELYIPWNNTWVYLPDLPEIEDPITEEKLPMSKTHIVSIDQKNKGPALLLLGGSAVKHEPINKKRDKATSRLVWRLQWQRENNTFSWTEHFDKEMGERCVAIIISSPNFS